MYTKYERVRIRLVHAPNGLVTRITLKIGISGGKCKLERKIQFFLPNTVNNKFVACI